MSKDKETKTKFNNLSDLDRILKLKQQGLTQREINNIINNERSNNRKQQL